MRAWSPRIINVSKLCSLFSHPHLCFLYRLCINSLASEADHAINKCLIVYLLPYDIPFFGDAMEETFLVPKEPLSDAFFLV